MGAADCCVQSLDGGCGDPGVEACVCNADPYCCEQEWDAACVNTVLEFGCGECALQDDPSCCVPHATPGCEVPEIAACVCATDPYCCDVFWDGLCATEVEELGCGPCDGTVDVLSGTGTSGGFEMTGPGTSGATPGTTGG
jgi:hypothetical protein